MNLYEFDTFAADNVGETGFPEGMLFSAFNDRFRAYMAAKAQLLSDVAGRNEAAPTPGPVGSTDLSVGTGTGSGGLFQVFKDPLPEGLLVTARVTATPANVPYLIVGDGVARPIVGPNAGALLPGSLEENSFYTFVLRDGAWQVVSELVGTPTESGRAELVGGSMALTPADVGGFVVVTSSGTDVEITVSAETLSRWPVGGVVSIAAVGLIDVSLTLPVTFSVGGGAVAGETAGTWLLYDGTGGNIFFQLLRTGADTLRLLAIQP